MFPPLPFKVFDKTGSMRSCYVDPSKNQSGNVLLDENYICNTPVYVHRHSKHVLMQAISMDTQFLAENRVMDYSLLACVEDATGELVLGIISRLPTSELVLGIIGRLSTGELVYWGSLTLCGHLLLIMYVKKTTNKVLPTVVYPELYRKRFFEAMERPNGAAAV
eukprot:Em0002g670a